MGFNLKLTVAVSKYEDIPTNTWRYFPLVDPKKISGNRLILSGVPTLLENLSRLGYFFKFEFKERYARGSFLSFTGRELQPQNPRELKPLFERGYSLTIQEVNFNRKTISNWNNQILYLCGDNPIIDMLDLVLPGLGVFDLVITRRPKGSHKRK